MMKIWMALILFSLTSTSYGDATLDEAVINQTALKGSLNTDAAHVFKKFAELKKIPGHWINVTIQYAGADGSPFSVTWTLASQAEFSEIMDDYKDQTILGYTVKPNKSFQAHQTNGKIAYQFYRSGGSLKLPPSFPVAKTAVTKRKILVRKIPRRRASMAMAGIAAMGVALGLGSVNNESAEAQELDLQDVNVEN